MRVYPQAVLDALAGGALVPRDFVWIRPRNRSTGDPVSWGAWSDLGTITAPVIDAQTGTEVSRNFEGGGSMVQVAGVQLVTGLTVQVVTITLNQIAAKAEELVRTYDARRAPVELYRGFMNPTTMRLVAPAEVYFQGFVDEAPVTTPATGEAGAIVLTCASHVQELARSYTATRSDSDQRRRSATDDFFQHAAVVGSWSINWKPKA